MEESQLILEYLKVLVWPCLLLWSLVFYKNEICRIIFSVSELKLGGDKGIKLKLRAVQQAVAIERNENTAEDDSQGLSSLVLSLPDEDFIYLDSLAKRPLQKNYEPRTGEELKSLYSLSAFGVFKQRGMSDFELTTIGAKLIESLRNF